MGFGFSPCDSTEPSRFDRAKKLITSIKELIGEIRELLIQLNGCLMKVIALAMLLGFLAWMLTHYDDGFTSVLKVFSLMQKLYP